MKVREQLQHDLFVGQIVHAVADDNRRVNVIDVMLSLIAGSVQAGTIEAIQSGENSLGGEVEGIKPATFCHALGLKPFDQRPQTDQVRIDLDEPIVPALEADELNPLVITYKNIISVITHLFLFPLEKLNSTTATVLIDQTALTVGRNLGLSGISIKVTFGYQREAAFGSIHDLALPVVHFFSAK